MHLNALVSWAAVIAGARAIAARASSPSVAGVQALVQRRLPQLADSFDFAIVDASDADELVNDSYSVSSSSDGKIRVEGNSVSGLLSGLHAYMSRSANVDIWWFIGNQLDEVSTLPTLSAPMKGSSVVPYRYHFNTVTTSYTSAFWTWEDWEFQLDWMALRGINLPLAWIGVEKIFIEIFQELGCTDDEIHDFLSGPAYLAWNHFGNIQGSWGGDLPFSWVDDQFAMQLKIVKRMLDLGMTPVLPAFTGFVPPAISRLFPDANISTSSVWENFSPEYTEDTFLDPFDDLFAQIQQSLISKQRAYYGNISSFYSLDQFNENYPSSNDTGYLGNLSSNTWKTLKQADPDAIWVLQSWMFSSQADFWGDEQIKAYLGGVETDSDMLVLDLFAESTPLWQKTNSYYGKPWIWCQLHNYGHNMGLYGQVMNITVNAIEALHNTTTTMVGMGLSMEGQEGNEIVYDLLLDQAWSDTALDTKTYFHDWVSTRYGASGVDSIPSSLYAAWELVRPTVYNNTNLTANAVTKSILELKPSTSGMLGRIGHHPTQLNYDTAVLVEAWNLMYQAGLSEPALFANPAYEHDLVDWTRQVLANAFVPLYEKLVAIYLAADNSTITAATRCSLRAQGSKMTALLDALDAVLATNTNFRLSTWISAARAAAPAGDDNGTVADFLEYEARTQITLWGPNGEISDYASKSWAGLVGTYYVPRWQMFVEYLVATPPGEYNQTVFEADTLLPWEQAWTMQTTGGSELDDVSGAGLEKVLAKVVKQWADVFA